MSDKSDKKQADASETLTIEEWKAERELFVKQFSVNNLFFLTKEERDLICEQVK